MVKAIYDYKRYLAKAEYHLQMQKLAKEQLSKTPCTDLKEKQRLYQAVYYHGKRYIAMLNKAHEALDRKVVKTHA